MLKTEVRREDRKGWGEAEFPSDFLSSAPTSLDFLQIMNVVYICIDIHGMDWISFWRLFKMVEEDTPDKDLLTSQQVAARLSVAVRTLWRMLARGQLPQPIRYNRRLVRWKASALQEYVDKLGR
jgi:excisionase family DNA binding protein